MSEAITCARYDAPDYSEFVHHISESDPGLVERAYELAFFGTPIWSGSPKQRIEKAIEADAQDSPEHRVFHCDYEAESSS